MLTPLLICIANCYGFVGYLATVRLWSVPSVQIHFLEVMTFLAFLSLSSYSETLSLSSLFTLAFLLRIRSLNICTTSLNIAKGTTDPLVNALKSNKIDEYWISTLQKIQLENESLYNEHCSCLYFVLLSELEHFDFLSQYYRPLGSWSALKDFHRKRIQWKLRSAGENRKWKL